MLGATVSETTAEPCKRREATNSTVRQEHSQDALKQVARCPLLPDFRVISCDLVVSGCFFMMQSEAC